MLISILDLLQQEVKRLREAVINPQMGSLGHKTLANPSIGDVLEATGAVYFNLGGKTLIEISPVVLERLFNGETKGLAIYAQGAVNAAFASSQARDPADRPALHFNLE